jgi:hypothetical protein
LWSDSLVVRRRAEQEAVAEIATKGSLPISKFMSVADAVPKKARATYDCMYPAMEINLKTHRRWMRSSRISYVGLGSSWTPSNSPTLRTSTFRRTSNSRSSSCSARSLYYDQLKLCYAEVGHDDEEARSEARSARMQAKANAALARENDTLRAELAMTRGANHRTCQTGGDQNRPQYRQNHREGASRPVLQT